MGAMRCRAGEARQKEVLRRFYDEHCAKIQKTVPPDRLCIMRLGDGWEPLVRDPCGGRLPVPVSNFAVNMPQCRFLGQEVPQVDFPHENDTKEMHLGWQYLRWGILKAVAKRSMPWVLAGVASILGSTFFVHLNPRKSR